MKVWAAYFETRWGDRGLSVHHSEREAWDAQSPFWSNADEPTREELERLLDTDLPAFRERFYGFLEGTDHEVLIEEVELS